MASRSILKLLANREVSFSQLYNQLKLEFMTGEWRF